MVAIWATYDTTITFGLSTDFGMAFAGEGQEQAVGAQHVVVDELARDGLVDERGLHPEAVAPVDGAPAAPVIIVREEDARGRELRRVLRAQPPVRRGLEHGSVRCRRQGGGVSLGRVVDGSAHFRFGFRW